MSTADKMNETLGKRIPRTIRSKMVNPGEDEENMLLDGKTSCLENASEEVFSFDVDSKQIIVDNSPATNNEEITIEEKASVKTSKKDPLSFIKKEKKANRMVGVRLDDDLDKIFGKIQRAMGTSTADAEVLRMCIKRVYLDYEDFFNEAA